MNRIARALALSTSFCLAGHAMSEESPLFTGSIGTAHARPAGVAGVDSATLKQAIAVAEKGDLAGAKAFEARLSDPVARALVEWFALRAARDGATTARINAFLSAHPGWPAEGALRSRAEAGLLTEKRSAADVMAYFSRTPPRSAAGRIALADALNQHGQGGRAANLLREAWVNRDLSNGVEKLARERLGNMIRPADDKRRMDMFLYEEDSDNALRLAQRLGSTQLAIARARLAVSNKAANAASALEAVPSEGRNDAGYIFSKIQFLRRAERHREAATLMMQAPRDAHTLIKPDEWWTERRLIARKLLDDGDAKTAYIICANHSASRDVDRMEAEFHAGWIAFRFLKDPQTADKHFATLQGDAQRSISVSRGNYWRGRTAEALGDTYAAARHYQAAARFGTTYYGQLARVKLGNGNLALGGPARGDDAGRYSLDRRPQMRAIRMLAAAGLADKARPFFLQLADTLTDAGELASLARFGEEIGQHRYALLVGKQASARGIALDYYAFPTSGLPATAQSGPPIERAVVFAIARQESTFDPRITSTAGAVGLLQLLPRTAAETARKYGISWQPGRLYEPAYNTQIGSAHLGELASELQGSYILTFAAYNAGRSRVREWIQRYGDPRDPNVDPVDWVERIPFSETRNYVMRVMENVQVYRNRLSGSQALSIDKDMRRGGK